LTLQLIHKFDMLEEVVIRDETVTLSAVNWSETAIALVMERKFFCRKTSVAPMFTLELALFQ